MLYLFPAIKVAFFANATLVAAFPGNGTKQGISLDEEPEDLDPPYVRVTAISAPREQTYGGAGYASPQLQFDVIGATAADARAKMIVFIGVWDAVTLSPTAGAIFYARRLNDPMPLPILGRDESADADVVGWTTTYEYANT